MRAVLLIAAAAVLIAAPGVRAATLTGEVLPPGGKGDPGGFRVSFTAGAGERNDVTVVQDTPSRVRVRDDGATLRVAGTGCRAVDDREAVCEGSLTMVRDFDLGDADDIVRRSDAPERIRLGAGDDMGTGSALAGEEGADELAGEDLAGGTGDDVLTLTFRAPFVTRTALGEAGEDRITGSEGRDALDGGPGRDLLTGGDGNDALADGDGDAPAADRFDGGAGSDTVSYRGRPAPVAVALATGASGAPGGEDEISSVEGAAGGDAGDTLLGDDGPNALAGGAGDDVLDGAGGDDALEDGGGDGNRLAGGAGNDRLVFQDASGVLSGGPGDDRLTGGPAADTLLGEDGDDRLDGFEGVDRLDGGAGADALRTVDLVRDVAECGAGRDRAVVNRGDATGRSCEAVVRRPIERLLDVGGRRAGRAVVPVVRGRVALTLLCGDSADCRGTLAVRVRGRRVVRRPFDCRQNAGDSCDIGGNVDLVARLPRAVARRVARRGPVGAVVVVTIVPEGGRGRLSRSDRVLLAERR